MRFVISRKNSLFILLLILLILGGIKFKDRVFKIYPLTSFFPDSSSTPEIHGPVRICLNSWSEFAARDFQIFPGPGPVQYCQFYGKMDQEKSGRGVFDL